MKPDYTGNHDCIDDLVIVFWMIQRSYFDHVSVLYLMSNHAQTILRETPLLEEPTDTPKLKHFAIDHNSSSVGS